MAQRYANQQPEGFVNHIKAIAIVGVTAANSHVRILSIKPTRHSQASGHVGHAFTDQLLQTGKHTVTAITRVGSKSLVSALKGQVLLVITLSLNAPPGTHTKLVKATAEAGVSYVVPNVHSVNFWDRKALRDYLPAGNNILANIAEVKEHGLVSLSIFDLKRTLRISRGLIPVA